MMCREEGRLVENGMPGWVKKLESFVNGLAMTISGVAFVGMVFLTSMNVLSRYFVGRSFNWSEEVTYMLFNWVVFFGAVVIYRHQGLTAIDVLVNRLPKALKRAVSIFNFALLLALNSALAVWGYQFAMKAWVRKSPSLHIPYFYYDISIPLACAIMAAYSLKFLILAAKGLEIREAAMEERS
jgi:TRAP-type C4-dicarboxylate transport system permease small subunit